MRERTGLEGETAFQGGETGSMWPFPSTWGFPEGRAVSLSHWASPECRGGGFPITWA